MYKQPIHLAVQRNPTWGFTTGEGSNGTSDPAPIIPEKNITYSDSIRGKLMIHDKSMSITLDDSAEVKRNGIHWRNRRIPW